MASSDNTDPNMNEVEISTPNVPAIEACENTSWSRPHEEHDLITLKFNAAKPKEVYNTNKNNFKGSVLKRIEKEKKPSVTLMSAGASASRLINIIDTVDREANAYAVGTYATSGTYADCKDESGKRIPKAGAYAGAGVGKARAEFSVFEAEANGPNASAGAEASATGVSAMARAEVGSVSAGAGPVNVSLGLGVDTGVSAGVDGVEVQFLGTGFRLGPKPSVSLLGSKLECVVM